MKYKNNFLITGNDEMMIDLFVSNFAYHKALFKEKNIIINDSSFNIFNRIKKTNFKNNEKPSVKNNDKIIKIFDFYTELKLPLIDIENLISYLSDKNKKELLKEFNEKNSNIFIISDFNSIYTDLYEGLNDIIIIIKNDPAIVSNFFELIKKLYNFNFNYYVIISNVKFIEDAVKIFLDLKKEITTLIPVNSSISFLGKLNIDIHKLYFSFKKEEIYIKIFKEDQFYGEIKFIEDKMKEQRDLVTENCFLSTLIEKY